MENIVSGNGNWYDYVGGFFAALWTPETWKATTVTAGTAVLPFPKGAQLINKGGATPVKIGQAGEEAVGISGAKTAIKINGRTRVPDQVTSEAVREVKNVNKLSYTKQLHDYVDYAQSTGKQLELHTRSSTKLSGPLNEAIGNGLIVHKFIPGM
ncbi:MAG: hypothetical protein A2Y12_19700 [Planctomycetes bacterium GWF2_42_9]|nr:MAG: hypothetical protein A2Y12_19700 [Planctomycetes bacterium GWF2_42_9]